jgi:hypothetical protein
MSIVVHMRDALRATIIKGVPDQHANRRLSSSSSGCPFEKTRRRRDELGVAHGPFAGGTKGHPARVRRRQRIVGWLSTSTRSGPWVAPAHRVRIDGSATCKKSWHSLVCSI